MTDPQIREAATQAKEMLAARPFSPQELLIRHMDLAVKFGSLPNLIPTGRKFGFIQYYNLDVYAIIFGGILLFIGTILFTFKRCCCTSKRVEKAKKQ